MGGKRDILIATTLRDVEDALRTCDVPARLHEYYCQRKSLLEALNDAVDVVLPLPPKKPH